MQAAATLLDVTRNRVTHQVRITGCPLRALATLRSVRGDPAPVPLRMPEVPRCPCDRPAAAEVLHRKEVQQKRAGAEE